MNGMKASFLSAYVPGLTVFHIYFDNVWGFPLLLVRD